MSIIIETENLNIEALNYEHEEILFDNLTAKAKNYMFPNGAKTKKDITIYIKKYLKNFEEQEDETQTDFLELVILEKKSNNLIGTIGLSNLNSPTPSIGLWIFEILNNLNLAQEALQHLKQNFQFQHLIYEIEEENTPMRRFVESIGATITKKFIRTDRNQQTTKMLNYRIPKN